MAVGCDAPPPISMRRASDFCFSTFGTTTVRTPLSTFAVMRSRSALSGRRNLRMKLPLLRSTRCQVSVFCTSSFCRCPLMLSVRPSSICTCTSSLRRPGRSALNTCSEGVSFQSTLVLATARASRANDVAGALSKSDTITSSGSGTASHTLFRRPPKNDESAIAADQMRNSIKCYNCPITHQDVLSILRRTV
ncbi:hypothetical protein M758_1G086600 [Ceratodon purpureus]|nr:hypothetical protein M758_1G086600 [Ceratodon purpureus]